MIERERLGTPQSAGEWHRYLADLKTDTAKGIFLMIGEETPFNFGWIKPILEEIDIPVFGGIFPGIICDGTWYKQGVLGCSILCPLKVTVIEELDNFTGLPEGGESDYKSMLVLIDGRVSNISSFLDKLFETCSSEVSFIGGGAGGLRGEVNRVLFTKHGFYKGGALLIAMQKTLGIGVRHGWQPMYGPLVANAAAGNIIKELNWQPAYHYYKQILEQQVALVISEDSFFDIAKGYPFGMVKMDGSIVVRDPLMIEGSSGIRLVGEVPANSLVLVLKGEPNNLIMAAGEAARNAEQMFIKKSGTEAEVALIIDCISRALYLGDQMGEELRGICQNLRPGIRKFGFLSLGEVASNCDKYIEFYNKTTVVGVG